MRWKTGIIYCGARMTPRAKDGVFDPGENSGELHRRGLGRENLSMSALLFERLKKFGTKMRGVSADAETMKGGAIRPYPPGALAALGIMNSMQYEEIKAMTRRERIPIDGITSGNMCACQNGVCAESLALAEPLLS